ncbi:MAG: hypothetical protein VKS61_17045 [Candidatus Sericytochromatia bacterium]|nr:hypothetical protein [Candidatus Sericytochromatia bacterium]
MTTTPSRPPPRAGGSAQPPRPGRRQLLRGAVTALALALAGCGAEPPGRTWALPAATHDGPWAPYDGAVEALSPGHQRGLQEVARAWGDVAAALQGTAVSPEGWASLRAACWPDRYPAGWTSPFPPGPTAEPSGLDLASPFVRRFGDVIAETGPGEFTPVALRGPTWHAHTAFQQAPDGRVHDIVTLTTGAGGERLAGLNVRARPTTGPCDEAWAGQPGVAPPTACLLALEDVTLSGSGLLKGRSASGHSWLAEGLADSGTSVVGGVRVPRGWRVRAVAADVTVEGTVRLAAVPTWEAPVSEAEGQATVATSRGVERLQLSWQQGGPTHVTFAGGSLRLDLDGSELPRVLDPRDGSVEALLERHGEVGGVWVAAILRRDGSRKSYVLGPADWRRWPLSPARDEAPVRDGEGFGPTPRRAPAALAPRLDPGF